MGSETPQHSAGSADNPRQLAWRREQILVLLVFSVIVAGGVALLILLVTRPPGDDFPEAGFARDMINHHAQAVEMEIVRDRTENQEIRTLATDIALSQQGQIGQMQGWLNVWSLPATGQEPAMAWMDHPTEERMPGMATPEEVAELREMSPEEMDERFLQLTIPHHRAALEMTEAVLERTDRPEVERLAGAIAAAQEAEFAAMEDMLQSMGASPAEADPSTPAGSNHSDHG